MKRLLRTALTTALVLAGGNAGAGAFINNQVNPALRTHPQNYAGVGGARSPIRVCVDIQANQPMAILAEPAVLKVIATLNRFRSLGEHNYAMHPATDMPAGQLDFESVLLHEMLHSQGLQHPNLAQESALPAPFSDGARSTAGANGSYQVDAGADGIYGSADDGRGDDVNLLWFARGVNDPGLLPARVDETTLAYTLDFLPPEHRHAAVAGRDVLAALGHADAEAVAYQGARIDEVQRHLHHDDVATVRLAEAGVDGIQGTADDYHSSYVYIGRQINPQGVDCQVAVRFDNTSALATTTTSALEIAPNHIAIWYARMRINPEANWYFSPGPNTAVSITPLAPSPGAPNAPLPVRVSVAKTPGNPMSGYPQGLVEVRDGARGDPGTAYCSVTLAGTPDETGECTLTPLRGGNRVLVADYLGYGGFDGGSASIAHVTSGDLVFSGVQDTPDPSAAGAEVEFRWTLAAQSGQPAAAASGTVTVTDAIACDAPPSQPQNQCSAVLPADRCSIRFAGAGARTMRLCYAGDGAFPAVSVEEPHDVIAGRATLTTIVSHTPASSAVYEPIAVTVSVVESPALGGHPAGSVIVRDGPAADPLTATCSVQMTGTPGETRTCSLTPVQAGPKTLTAEYAPQTVWAASSASAAAPVGSLAIVRHAPGISRLGQGVSVVVDLDVAPYLSGTQPTGTITISGGTDSCEIVLPARECLWRGSVAGVHSLVASWPGDANHAARSSAAVSQVVQPGTYPQLLSEGRSAYADSDGNSTMSRFALSADGRRLVFASDAVNLVEEDSNGARDIFLRDVRSGAVRRVSTDVFGVQANGASAAATISADGRYVAFSSLASNLVPGDTNGVRDLFVKDLATGIIVRASLRADGTQDTTANEFFGIDSALSADGRFIAFAIGGALLPSDGNGFGQTDIYVRDLRSGALDLVTSTSEDIQGDFRSAGPAISADGRYVAFSSQSSNFPGNTGTTPQLYVKDRLTRRLLHASSDAAGVVGNRASFEPALSVDGRYVAFTSQARNFFLPDNNDYNILVKDLLTGALQRVSVNDAGQIYGRSNGAAAFSADARYVVFTSLAYAPSQQVDVYRKDRQTGQLLRLSVDTAGVPVTAGNSGSPAISADGRLVAFQSAAPDLVAGDRNGMTDAFVRDIQLSTTVRASAATNGSQADGDSAEAAVSQDGRYVTFSSLAGNLVNGDGDPRRDIFLQDRNGAGITRLSVNTSGSTANGASDSPAISADGNWIAFRSDASNLIAGDSNTRADIFVSNRASGAVVRVSTSSAGAQGTAAASGPVGISGDGDWVVFGAADGNLVPGDTNGVQDILAKQTSTGATLLVSADAAGVPGNGDSVQAAISNDATRVAFASSASNLAADDANGVRDIYVKTLAGGAIVRASSTAAGLPGNGASADPAISANGRYVVFASAASNLVSGDTNANVDIFIKDLDSGDIQRVNTSAAGAQGSGGDCATPSLSSDARYVGFVCAQSGLVADGSGLAGMFVKDRQSGTIRRLSVNAGGVPANAASAATARALADSGIAVFVSAADNLAAADRQRFADVFAQRYAVAGEIATTTVIGTHTPDPTPAGASFTVSVAVTRSSGSAAIVGTVAVGSGDSYCSASLSGSGATATGQCNLLATSLGLRQLRAIYSGDANYAASDAPPVNHRVIGSRVPAPPRIISAVAGNARVTVAFAAPDDPGGSPVTSYRATCGAASVTAAATPIAVTGLTNGVAVTCTLIATNAAGDSPPSTPSASVTPATLPGAPVSVAATRGNGEVSIAFAAGSSGGSPILDYNAQCGDSNRSATTSPIRIAGLANGTPVTCRVTARNAVGRGTASAPVNVTPATVPDAPTAVTAVRGDARVTVSFAAAGNGGDPVTGYTAHCGAATAGGSASPISVTGLTNGVAVTCTVIAANGIGSSLPSSPSASVTPATVPGAPQLLTLTPGAGSAQLQFTAPAQQGGAPVQHYLATCMPGTLTATAAASPLQISGLTNGTLYTCSVQAVNEVGEGAASNTLTVTPRAPADLAISNSNGSDFVQGGAPTGYLVDVTNSGGAAVLGARVLSAPAATFTGVSWICSAQGGGACPASGSGALDALIDLPAGASVSFLISGTVAALPEQSLSSTATVTLPASMVDTNPADNSATDGPDTVGLFRNGFE
jgi:Tol biopolymer transport system component